MIIRGRLDKGFLKLLIFLLLLLCQFIWSDTAREFQIQGEALYNKNEYYQAIDLFKKSLEINPDYIKPHYYLAQSYYYLGECEEAYSHIQKTILLDSTQNDYKTLEGNILICQGDLAQARAQFEGVLKIEPNNIEARFGLAELEITENKKKKALGQLQEALKVAPQSKKALLKLAEINLESGNPQEALQFIELALKYHFSDPEVHYIQALYFLKEDRLDRAIHFLNVALSINEKYFKAIELLAKLYFNQANYDLAIKTIQKNFISKNTDHLYFAYYLSGVFKAKTKDYQGAMDDFKRTLEFKYDDEVARIFSESLAIEKLLPTDSFRMELAKFHTEQAKGLLAKDYLSLTLLENRRALMLNPNLLDVRISHAEIYRILGYKYKYYFMLAVLKQNFKDTPNAVNDSLSLKTKDIINSLSYKWTKALKKLLPSTPLIKVNKDEFVDPYSIPRSQIPVSLFTIKDENQLFHFGSDEILLNFIHDVFLRHDQFKITSSKILERKSLVLGESRKNDSDYFFVFRIVEEKRSFSLFADLYLSSTGRLIKSFNSFRTGNFRIRNAVDTLINKITGEFPRKGMLLARSFNRALINLGKRDGINDKDTLLIIKKNKLNLSKKLLDFNYTEDNVIGEIEINVIDETLSEGRIKKYGFFDFINPYDEIIIKTPEEEIKKPAA